jgi:hypothetical protein
MLPIDSVMFLAVTEQRKQQTTGTASQFAELHTGNKCHGMRDNGRSGVSALQRNWRAVQIRQIIQ